MGSVFQLLKVPQRHTPVRRPNHELRTREHLTEREVEKLIEAAKGNRWGHRDATMILIAYRHGLRTSELVDLRWDQVHLTSAILDVEKKKRQPRYSPSHWPRITRPEAPEAGAGPSRRSFSPRSVVIRSRPRASPACCSALGRPPG